MLRAVLRRRPSGGPGAYRRQGDSLGTAFRQVECEFRGTSVRGCDYLQVDGRGPVSVTREQEVAEGDAFLGIGFRNGASALANESE